MRWGSSSLLRIPPNPPPRLTTKQFTYKTTTESKTENQDGSSMEYLRPHALSLRGARPGAHTAGRT